LQRFLIVPALALIGSLFAGCASAPPPRIDAFTGVDTNSDPVEISDVEGVERRLFRDGRVYVAGQPSREALIELAGRGVTAVVNLRTPREMADPEKWPFEEAAVADSLGLEYVSLPVGGLDHPYRPSVLSGFNEIMNDHDGKVLIHCRSGWRASYVWAAYLIRHRGWTIDEGLQRAMAIGVTAHPLQRLLDKELILIER
jgi:uncharacterized protein (TIGR01244 family)